MNRYSIFNNRNSNKGNQGYSVMKSVQSLSRDEYQAWKTDKQNKEHKVNESYTQSNKSK